MNLCEIAARQTADLPVLILESANAKNPGFLPGLIIPPLVLSAIILALPTDAEGVAYFRVLLQSLLFNSSVFGLRHLSHGVQACGGLALIVVSIAAGKVDNVVQYVAVFASTTFGFAATHVLTRFMLQDSVSIGEALTISLSLSAFLSDAVITTFQKMHLATISARFRGVLRSIVWISENVGNIGIFPRSEVYIFMHALVLGMLAIGVVSMPLLRKIRASDSTNAPKQHIALSALFFGIAAIAVLLGIRPWTWMLIGAEPFFWTYEFVTSSSTRIALSAFWALLISIAVAIAVHKFPPTVSTSSALNLKRKYFHVLATAMFLPGYLIDPEYMHLAFSVASSALILIEYIRFFNIWPLGQGIHNFMCQFLNERDSGPVVLSHLYLLSGCALPVWLNKIAMQSVLGGLSGILTLGIGDTMASVCGKRFGRIHWPGTSKTVEGTLAFILSISTALLVSSTLDIVAIDSWATIMICVTLSSLLEAFSDQNDNLIIPLYTFGMLHLLTAR
ncbi:hypothetical protein HDU85_003111 [Gaertneriomyces sp. JEL0708]|nr:hypothetical protein HDU85_003111 [Gaertneriomyces sp. JEL0708]